MSETTIEAVEEMKWCPMSKGSCATIECAWWTDKACAVATLARALTPQSDLLLSNVDAVELGELVTDSETGESHLSRSDVDALLRAQVLDAINNHDEAAYQKAWADLESARGHVHSESVPEYPE